MSTFTPEFQQQVLDYYYNNKQNKAKTCREFNISTYAIRSFLDPSVKEYNRKANSKHQRKVKAEKEKKKYKRIIEKHTKKTLENILHKPYLSYEYPISECFREYEWYKNHKGGLTPVTSNNKIVLTFQPHFYEIEKRLWLENKDDLRQKLVSNRIKYIEKDEYQLTDKEVLRGFKISGKHIGFSHFNPCWMKYFIEKYNITSVYDPTGGWGHRLLGSNNIKYIYNDLDERTYIGCKAIAQTFAMENKVFYNQDATKFTPEEDYEAIFTCPPYHNTEIYQNGPYTDYDEYLLFWRNVVLASRKDAKYFAYVINNQYLQDTKKIVEENFGSCIEESPITDKLNHFQSKKEIEKGEKLLVFKR